MEKVRVIGFKKDKESLLGLLQKRGSLEIIDDKSLSSQVVGSEGGTEFDSAGVKFAIEFLSAFSTEKVPLKDKISGKKIEIEESDFFAFFDSYPFQKIITQAQEIEAGLNESNAKIAQIKEEVALLRPWSSLNQVLIKETQTSQLFLVIVSEAKYKLLNQELNQFKFSNIRLINQIDKNFYLEIILPKGDKKAEVFFEQFNLEKEELPCSNLSPKATILKLESDLDQLENKKEELNKRAKELSKEVKNLKIIFDLLNLKREKGQIKEKIFETEKLFILTGWLEQNCLKDLDQEIKKISNFIFIEKLEVKKDEERPVVLRNSPFWQPFETVTGIYGLPKYHEIDPTPILAPFFILFFALCLTDAGYGIILMLLSFLAIKVLKVPKASHNLFRLLGYGGFVTLIIGALFGGWFGLDSNYFPPLLRDLQLINPVENPILVLILSLGIGFLQVITGLGVAFYRKVKSGELKEAILDHGSWIVFLLAICFYFIIGLNHLLSVVVVFWSSLALVVYSQGRHQKNLFARLIIGIGGLYGLIGYLSDILSYARLLALGLATGIIAMVVNMLALIAGDLVPYVGPILAVIIIVIGHIFNLAINTLGSFIHSGRLQFVEFFPKFMDGGGKRFLPFQRNLRYVEIVK